MLAAVTAVPFLLAVAPGPAALASAPCTPVRLSGTGQADLGAFTTTATLSWHGHVVGTTRASFTPTGGDATTATFTGPIVFIPHRLPGTLTATVTGAITLNDGAFTNDSTSVTGSGRLAGVTGQLHFAGVEDLSTGVFTETVTGRLCADLQLW